GFWTHCFESKDEMEQAIADGAKRRNISIDDFRSRAGSSLWGTPEMLIEKLQSFEELDVSHAILMLPHKSETEQIELINREVLRKL
ncbi:MAG: hypothetical protein ACFFD3_06265, partial [Candidatus Thorarchaeota archaeon]